MFKFLAGRLVQMAILFVIFLTLIWFLLQAMPGDISDTLIGNPEHPAPATPRPPGAARARPAPVAAVLHVHHELLPAARLGVSFSRYPEDVSVVLFNALPRTLVLFLSATLFAFWLGFKAGKFIAWRRGAVAEKGMIVSGIFLQTVFYPWFAIIMLWLFGFYLGWFPIGRFITADLWQGAPYNANEVFSQMIVSVVVVTVLYGIGRWLIARYSRNLVTQIRASQVLGIVAVGSLLLFWWVRPETEYVADIAHHTILPVITLGLVAFGATMLLTRSAMLETLGEDYILTARAKGIPDWIIRDRHAARNAMLPVTTSLVLALAFVIGGGIVTETIFSWPGMGLVFLQAINVSDIPLAVGALAITGVLALFGHLIADILYAVLDPRIRIA